jgi:hypothetical protein
MRETTQTALVEAALLPEEWPVPFKSDLRPDGAVYTPLARFGLGQ